jgi:hypothetical protein
MKKRVRDFLHAVPFTPFVIRTADGKEYRVDHPDFVAAGSDTPNIYIEDVRGNFTFLSALLITSVGTQENGKTARRSRRPRKR